jgi:rod shape determining protein RodA
MFDRRLLEDFDWVLLFITVLISTIGFVAIYSASNSYGTVTPYFQKQVLWFFIGLGVMVIAVMIDYRFILRFAPLLHLIMIAFLILVLVYGTGGAGTRVERWLQIGPVFFQPSEFAKFSLILYFAQYFSESRRIGDLGAREIIWPVIVTLVPFFLIVKQPDLGTAVMLIFIFFAVIFLVGIRIKLVLFSTLLAVISIPFIWIFLLKQYQRERIFTLVSPEMDPLGQGYQIIQSKIAVGSGLLWGKGYLQGTQALLDFLPARHTDFIFSVFTEEWGFVGGVLLVLLYAFLILWCLRFVGKTKNRSGSILTVGIVAILTSQIVINIGMVIGLLPVVGMPLPFMSYGGSAMLSHMIGIGLILNVHMRRYDI